MTCVVLLIFIRNGFCNAFAAVNPKPQSNRTAKSTRNMAVLLA
jgi:hypothetical protein